MNVPQNPSWKAAAVTTSRRLSLAIKAPIAGMLCMAGQVNAQVPDLTAGELPVNAGVWFNLGPTGVQAWVYRGIEGGPTPDTGLSRQIQVRTIEAESPAAGILALGDVILGADGTGAAPVPFTSDARKPGHRRASRHRHRRWCGNGGSHLDRRAARRLEAIRPNKSRVNVHCWIHPS